VTAAIGGAGARQLRARAPHCEGSVTAALLILVNKEFGRVGRAHQCPLSIGKRCGGEIRAILAVYMERPSPLSIGKLGDFNIDSVAFISKRVIKHDYLNCKKGILT
jgi:hypothetical protein